MATDTAKLESTFQAYKRKHRNALGRHAHDYQAEKVYAFESLFMAGLDELSRPVRPRDIADQVCAAYRIAPPKVVSFEQFEPLLPRSDDQQVSALYNAPLHALAFNPRSLEVNRNGTVPLWLALHETAHAVHNKLNEEFEHRYPNMEDDADGSTAARIRVLNWNMVHGPFWLGIYGWSLGHMTGLDMRGMPHAVYQRGIRMANVEGCGPDVIRDGLVQLFA